jgi:sigma-E factor negative regulatory protein RseA
MVEMNTNMSNASAASREQISRWLDGDIAPHEIELAMATLSREDGRYCWAEMHFVGDCIRGLENTPSGCAERIRSAIAAEPTVVAPVARRLREQAQHKERSMVAAMTSIGRGGRAWATAAAVAAVGFVGTVVYKDQVATPQVAALPASSATAPMAAAKPNADFNAYLQAHQESADVSSLSPMRQYLRPAVIVQGQ